MMGHRALSSEDFVRRLHEIQNHEIRSECHTYTVIREVNSSERPPSLCKAKINFARLLIRAWLTSSLLHQHLATMAGNRISPLLSRFSNYRHSFNGSRYVLFAIASWTAAIIFFNEHVGEVGRINGPSMYPYLNTSYNENLKKDLCWINKWNPTSDLRRGMIVAFR